MLFFFQNMEVLGIENHLKIHFFFLIETELKSCSEGWL